MQNLANNTQLGGLKEAYMAPLNKFLDSIRPRFNEFLEELTKVEDLDEQLHVSFHRNFWYFSNILFSNFFSENFREISQKISDSL